MPLVGERFEPLDFDRFHGVELPKKLAGHGPFDLRRLKPIAFCIEDGRSYTYVPDRTEIRVEPGAEEASTVVELSWADWLDFVWELRSCFALLYGERLRLVRGTFGQLSRWEPVLRSVFDDQIVYDIDDPPPLLDKEGGPLGLDRIFTLDDTDDDIAEFLALAGFVHLRSVYSSSEVDALVDEVEKGVTAARPDDQRSWWTTVDGQEVCNRVNYLNDRSQTIAEIGADPRMQRIGRLGGADLREAADRLDGHSVVIKVPGASSGLADLPWHRDCGMGGHPVKCPMLNVGIQLDAATAATGQLQMIAGSHRGTSRLPDAREADSLPVVSLTTESGDVTVHWGHTLHAAPPPLDRGAAGRRALYVTYVAPLTFEMMAPGEGYNDVLFTRDAGRVRHVDEIV
jgi:hypothetical protein